mmetsp:Transcript_17508/g.53598  ORF Transcript_17508/g.53598 Transcript_17508/m.53598 type:complete len:333 (+) Transcript_17508:94-1092(+)
MHSLRTHMGTHTCTHTNVWDSPPSPASQTCNIISRALDIQQLTHKELRRRGGAAKASHSIPFLSIQPRAGHVQHERVERLGEVLEGAAELEQRVAAAHPEECRLHLGDALGEHHGDVRRLHAEGRHRVVREPRDRVHARLLGHDEVVLAAPEAVRAALGPAKVPHRREELGGLQRRAVLQHHKVVALVAAPARGVDRCDAGVVRHVLDEHGLAELRHGRAEDDAALGERPLVVVLRGPAPLRGGHAGLGEVCLYAYHRLAALALECRHARRKLLRADLEAFPALCQPKLCARRLRALAVRHVPVQPQRVVIAGLEAAARRQLRREAHGKVKV